MSKRLKTDPITGQRWAMVHRKNREIGWLYNSEYAAYESLTDEARDEGWTVERIAITTEQWP